VFLPCGPQGIGREHTAHLIGALAGHAMRHNAIGRLAGLIPQAGFHVTGSGDRWHRLHYVQARRPTAGSGSATRDDPQAADHDDHGDGDHQRGP
jgi:hypothetical protein